MKEKKMSGDRDCFSASAARGRAEAVPISTVLATPERLSARFAQERDVEKRAWRHSIWQVLRFCAVGGVNTVLDLLILNVFLWLLPTKETVMLLMYSSLAYLVGGINSFVLNKYWTFRRPNPLALGEIRRFVATMLLGILCNDLLLWLAGNLLHLLLPDIHLWATLSKLLALSGTVLISYLGMRLWVFRTSV